ncbi:MAG: alpha-mannosidase [Dysgonamonadaceae bacterium]|jgi:alpha-mannosidase|nr:alpha-mannosidase [Dysgonamonadaceae bacterium]
MKIRLFLVTLGTAWSLSAQTPYFADGYHGGIYGHYPLWQTQFMVDQLNEHPDWKINLEIEPETWDSVRLKTPDAYKQWQAQVNNPRIEWTNPTYAQPYGFNISGESLIRQFEYGIRKIRQHFPMVSCYTYAVEEPCFTSALPQILRSFGFQAAVLKNPDTCWGGYVDGFGSGVVRWIGPDGTAIPAVPRYACEALEKNSTWQTTSWNNSDDYLMACAAANVRRPVGMCYQDAGWKNGPWLGSGENVKNNSRYVTWREYFSAVNQGETTGDWYLSQENIRVSLMWGSQVLQRIAQQVRQSENAIVRAEKVASMAWIERNEAFPDIWADEAWRTLLLAQHHDSWIVPYNRLNKKRTWAEEIALWTANTDSLADKIIQRTINERESGHYIRIYNTLPYARQVEIPELPYPVALPPFGYKTVRWDEKSTLQALEQGISWLSEQECMIENKYYRITFDLSQGGIIKNLIAKYLNNKEFVDNQNQFAFGELRGYFYEKNRFISNREHPARLAVVENNALCKQIRIESQIDGNTCITTITLHSSSEIIDFSLQIGWEGTPGVGEYSQGNNWRENRRAFYDDRFKLNVLFPAQIPDAKLFKDAPFDVCESRMKNTFYNTWDSIKNNIILNWVDLAQANEQYGLALFSDHTTSYSFGADFPLGLTLQYSGTGLWGENYNITQSLKVNYALLPHQGKWDKAAIGTKNTEWNEKPVVAFLKTAETGEKSFLQFDKQGYEITACKPGGNKEMILRVFNKESDGQAVEIRFNFPVKSVMETALNGETEAVCEVENNKIKVSVPRFGIKTLRIQKQ